MSARHTLTNELRAEVLRLEDDLRTRVAALPQVQTAWRTEYDAAREVERTSAAWEEWVDERVTLAAVAWVLTTVFIRFCEDNGLVKPVWISGPRSSEALEAQQQFLRETARVNPDVTDREWLVQAVKHLQSLPATAGLVDATSPMCLVSPSGDAATRLLTYWRARDEEGNLLRDLADPSMDTRFLGDIYQDISEEAKKRYALLQTPVFVEEFILDRTLEPALNERPLEGFKMIDPTCGSGHFLLGGFARLLDRWHRHAPAMDERERVQAALDSVYGVDINPFAVAIARFRLTVAALQASGLSSLECAPAFKYHLAVGDSLLHGLDQPELDLGAQYSIDQVAAKFVYATESIDSLRSILRTSQFDAVVGNPPYITVKDKALNQLYRTIYATAFRKYALSVPFMERFFQLGKVGSLPGWIGQITSNSFMRREFGVPLVEVFLPTKDLRLIADTSGAYIPGHGTPTVIIVGRNSRPVASTLRAVLGIRGEPSQPDDPASGKVWTSLVEHVDDPSWSDDWTSVADIDRSALASHPWSLSGGGEIEFLKAIVDVRAGRLFDVAYRIGVFGMTNADAAMTVDADLMTRRGLERRGAQRVVVGDKVRDFRVLDCEWVWFPYSTGHELCPLGEFPRWARYLWPQRTELGNRATFSKGTYFSDARPWYEWHQLPKDVGAGVRTICCAEIATHNHFVLDSGGKVFKQTAPVIKLPGNATEDQHLALLGVLNSSTACFWLRQNSHNKGAGSHGEGIADESWEWRFAFNATTLRDLPLPSSLPLGHGAKLQGLAQELSARSPAALAASVVPSRSALDIGCAAYRDILAAMIAEQEELDWDVYGKYGLIDEILAGDAQDLPGLALGERAFEIVLARRVAAGEEDTAWFERHGSTPLTEIPAYWPRPYRDRVQRRIDLINSHPYLRIVERPEYKRRWSTQSWEKQEELALRIWLLDRLEDRMFWFDQQGRPIPQSVAALADAVARDPDTVSVLALREGRPDVPLATSLERLLTPETVPFLAAYRYKDSGLRKRAAWEATWTLQRLEDAGKYNPAPKNLGGDGPIPFPPKYASADFVHTEYWANRGKLDVPKERFILYPNAGRSGDPTPVIGWAGWDHAQQALALATLVQSGEQQGWSDDRLMPLVAGLDELLPWVEQWHRQPEPLYGGSSPAEFFTGLLEGYMAKIGATRETLRARPSAPTAATRAGR